MIDQENGVFPAVCPLDCPDTCGLLLHKENGKIVKVAGNPDHPITKGAICNKVRNMTERVYHPERLQYPLRRIGAKGEGQFERISWDEAIGEITAKFSSLADTYGPESILPYSFYGNMGILGVDGMDRRFFNALGASMLEQTICNAAGNTGGNIRWVRTGEPCPRIQSMRMSFWYGEATSSAPICIRLFWPRKPAKREPKSSSSTSIAIGPPNGETGSFHSTPVQTVHWHSD